MKKRILALALAGTTAFSVFGGLNVFAATNEHEDSEAFANDYVLTKVTTTENGWVRFDDKTFDKADLITVMDFEDVMAEPVTSGTTYFYDFLDDLNDKYRTDYDQADVEKAIEDGLDAEPVSSEKLSLIIGGGKLVKGATIAREDGYGDKGTIREDVVDAFEDFIAGISLDINDYEYLYDYDDDGAADDDVYNFAELIEILNDWVGDDGKTTKNDAYLNKATSRLVYMMQEYERLVEVNEYVTVKEIETEDLAELLIAILEARSEDDYDTTKQYRAWTADLEDLIEAYEEAETRGEYVKAYKALYDEVTTKDSEAAKSDLTDLAAAKATTLTIGDITRDLYPAADFKDTSGVSVEGVAFKVTEEYAWYKTVLDLAETMYKMGKSYNFQGSVDVITEALNDAVAALVPTTTPRASRLLSLEEYVDKYEGLIEGDYKATAWKNYTKAMDYAVAMLEGDAGEQQVKNAVDLLIPAAEAMDLCDNHTKVKAAQIKALKAAIADAEDWLDEYDDTAAVSKILAVTKALDNANEVLDDHTVDYKKNEVCALVSEVEGAIADIDAALSSKAVATGWLKTDAGWTYGTEDGYLNNGWAKIGAVWYYFDADGTAKESEWLLDNGKWYYFTSGCNAVAANWAQVNGKWYYFDHSCAMVTGWLWNNNCWYYLDASGAMVTDTVVDGYTIGADGVML